MSRIVFRGALICAWACLLLAEARPAHAGNQVVGDCGDNGGANQLRAKLNAAQSSGGGTLTFTCGPTIVLDGTALPNITTNITINGANAITLSGNHASRLFYVNPGATLTLNDLTITNGDADFDADGINDGGAIYSLGTLNIHNSKFLNNLTTKGNGGALLTKNDFKVEAGWGHTGKDGVTMPGKGKIVERRDLTGFQNLSGLAYDIYLNDIAYWHNIPKRVWDYTIGGYPVIKKWLSYREYNRLGRALAADEVREVTNMARRIAAITLLEPDLDANYQAVKQATYAWPHKT